MRASFVAAATLAAAVTLTGCGSHSTNALRRCFSVWNDASNRPRQAAVAGRFVIASVSEWRAELAAGTVDLGGRANEGCGYLFHTTKAYVSISGVWRGGSIRWGVPPSIHGTWSPQQQSAVTDNAAVDADGLLNVRQ